MRYLFFLFLPLFAEPLHYFKDAAFDSVVHVLEVDLSSCSMELIKCDGLEKTSAVAKRLHADAAINGGFFKRDGFPSGIFKLHSIQYTPTDRKRGAIGWRSDYSDILIDRLDERLCPIFHPENRARFEKMETILGTTPVLIIDGAILENFDEEKVRPTFVTNRQARSAVGWADPSHLLFVVVTKDLKGKSLGMTIPQLAKYLHSLGAQFAINLDGGGSSTLHYKGKTVSFLGEINEDANLNLLYGERMVSNVIVLKETSR
jgi:hypothetical protein